MDALILAAGFGTRLYPLTENIPKAFIKINGKPVLENTIEKLKKIKELENIYIITNNKFYNLFKEWVARLNYNKKIKIINDGIDSEEEKKGAVGDFKFALNQISYNDLFVLASDHLFDFDLNKVLITAKKKNGSVFAIKRMKKEEIKGKYGCILIDNNGKVIAFEEKPKEPKSDLVCIACYFLLKKDLDKIKGHNFENLENMGYLVDFLYRNSDVYGKILKENWIDIGSKTEIEKAKKYFNN